MHFTPKTLDFLFENHINDSKLWFDEHKNEYTKYVFEPMRDLAEKLGPHMLKIDSKLTIEPRVDRTISRIRRDTRFSHDKSLYRANMWLIFKRGKMYGTEVPGLYVDFSGEGFSYGCGFYYASTGYMSTFRNMILDKDKFFLKIKKAFDNQNTYVLDGDLYKRPHYPEQPKDLQNWLDRRGISFNAHSKDFDLLFSDKLADKLIADFELLAPMYQFLLYVAEQYRIENHVKESAVK